MTYQSSCTSAVSMSWPSYIKYHGLALPPGAHSEDSLEYAENFSVEDTDVFSVTYPKSGTVLDQSCLFSHL